LLRPYYYFCCKVLLLGFPLLSFLSYPIDPISVVATNKQTLLTPESLEQQILPQKFVRNFAAAAAPPPPRASPENQNLRGETSHRDDDVDFYFSFSFSFRFFLIFLRARQKKKDDRTNLPQLSENGGTW
jgi:hypothetical protein